MMTFFQVRAKVSRTNLSFNRHNLFAKPMFLVSSREQNERICAKITICGWWTASSLVNQKLSMQGRGQVPGLAQGHQLCPCTGSEFNMFTFMSSFASTVADRIKSHRQVHQHWQCKTKIGEFKQIVDCFNLVKEVFPRGVSLLQNKQYRYKMK